MLENTCNDNDFSLQRNTKFNEDLNKAVHEIPTC